MIRTRVESNSLGQVTDPEVNLDGRSVSWQPKKRQSS